MNEQQIIKNQLGTDIMEWVKDYNLFQEQVKNDEDESNSVSLIETANDLVEKFARYLNS